MISSMATETQKSTHVCTTVIGWLKVLHFYILLLMPIKLKFTFSCLRNRVATSVLTTSRGIGEGLSRSQRKAHLCDIVGDVLVSLSMHIRSDVIMPQHWCKTLS